MTKRFTKKSNFLNSFLTYNKDSQSSGMKGGDVEMSNNLSNHAEVGAS